ncbi:Sodium/glutamate symporter [Salmonella enterica subsp. enterica serovar Typhimurium]
MTLRDPLMLAFFATIGLNANLASLRKGDALLASSWSSWSDYC